MTALKTIALALMFSSIPEVASAEDCKFDHAPSVLFADGEPGLPGSSLFQVWEVRSSESLFTTTLPSHQDFQRFRHAIRKAVPNLNQEVLLAKSIAEGSLAAYDKQNAEQTLARKDDLIRPVGCLEALLLSVQTGRLDMTKMPTEFVAFVLHSQVGSRLRIYYYTSNQPGIRGAVVKSMR